MTDPPAEPDPPHTNQEIAPDPDQLLEQLLALPPEARYELTLSLARTIAAMQHQATPDELQKLDPHIQTLHNLIDIFKAGDSLPPRS